MAHRPFLLASRSTRFFLTWYVLMAIWWLAMTSIGYQEEPLNYFFGFVFVLIPLAGGLFGFYRSFRWGFLQSLMGKATLLLSCGFLAWGVGGLMYSYYNFFLAVEAPYPSVADFVYLSSYPFWALGIFYLSQVIGVKLSLRRMEGKLAFFLVPIFAAAISYYLVVIVARGGALDLSGSLAKVFVDIAYPLSDIIMVTLTILVSTLSFQHLGGRFKWPVLILLSGFFINYIADFSFAWQTTAETWYVGNWVDFLYTTSMTTLVLGLVGLNPDREST